MGSSFYYCPHLPLHPPINRATHEPMSRPNPPLAPRLDPLLLLRAYAMGIFPMADDRDAEDIYWVEPKTRGILPLESFHLSKSLRKLLISGRYRVTSDTAFRAVIAQCAASAPDRPSTWINALIEEAFIVLHTLGHAHSVEVWDDVPLGQGYPPRLVGGLYGLSLGRAFFGESMFSRADNTSKLALAWLVARMKAGGFELLDCQFITDHLASLGAIEISRSDYLVRLHSALGDSVGVALSSTLGAGDLGAGALGAGVLVAADLAGGDWAALEPLLAGGLTLPGEPWTPAMPSRSGLSTSAGLTAGPPPGVVIAQLLTMTS